MQASHTIFAYDMSMPILPVLNGWLQQRHQLVPSLSPHLVEHPCACVAVQRLTIFAVHLTQHGNRRITYAHSCMYDMAYLSRRALAPDAGRSHRFEAHPVMSGTRSASMYLQYTNKATVTALSHAVHIQQAIPPGSSRHRILHRTQL